LADESLITAQAQIIIIHPQPLYLNFFVSLATLLNVQNILTFLCSFILGVVYDDKIKSVGSSLVHNSVV